MAQENAARALEVLIVEDSLTQAEDLRYMLDRRGFKTSVARNGQEAFESVRAHKPGLVITDVIMPEMDGFTLCKKIKAEKDLRDVPVMLLTALSDAEDILKGLECGADDFVTKPYDPNYLVFHIANALSSAKTRENAQTTAAAEIAFGEKRYFITSGQGRILELLLSTYETAVMKNRELRLAQQELKTLNEQLEYKVKESRQAEEALRRKKEKIELLAESARMLLSTESPEKIVQALAEKVMRYLNCHAFLNYLIEDGKQRMRLNAWYGIPETAAKEIEFQDFGASICGCAAREERRIIAEDIPGNPDERTSLFNSLGIKAYACHPLVYQGKMIGTLSFGTCERTHFTEEELDLMETVTDQVATAMARKRVDDALKESERALRSSLQEKETLLRELYHRTKNNMHIITNLISLQMASKGNITEENMRDLQGRIQAMALVHEKLYKRDLSRLDLKDYVTDLVKALVSSYLKGGRDISVELALDTAVVSIDTAIPCGLIINELVSNCLKYAFPNGKAGIISLALTNLNDEQIEIRVSDNGKGLPGDVDVKKASTMGLKIVYNLVRQLMGTVEARNKKGGGTEFIIRVAKD